MFCILFLKSGATAVIRNLDYNATLTALKFIRCLVHQAVNGNCEQFASLSQDLGVSLTTL